MPAWSRSVRTRLAAIIVLAMTAFVVLLIYQNIHEWRSERDEGEQNLERLAAFAAHAQRERFDAVRRLLGVAAPVSPVLRAAATNPESQEALDACTQQLAVVDDLLPEAIGFMLWDRSGNVICSSEGARPGQYSAAGEIWFQQAQQRHDFATGGYQLSPPDNRPSIGFGLPVWDETHTNVIAYFSTDAELAFADVITSSQDLPDTGTLAIVDRNGTIISSTSRVTGVTLEGYDESFGSLGFFLDSAEADVPGDRHAAAARVTDGDDSPVTVVVSADHEALALPLTETLTDNVVPFALIGIVTLGVVWLLADRWVAAPVGSLVRASSRLGAGELSARADVSHGVAEFETLAHAFNDMAETRERASAAKDEFLGLVSHELKTPITTALGNAEILHLRGDSLDPESRRLALADIHESTLRLASIIDNMLVLARLERGVDLGSEPVAITRSAQTIAAEHMHRQPGRRVNVQGDPAILALASEAYVEQVLENLIANALKYSPPDTAVDVMIGCHDEMVLVSVRDRGAGVDQRERERIFEPFYRSARAVIAAEGMGIGLAVCRRLVEAMGGRLWYVPHEGGGSDFRFTLPLLIEEQIGTPEQEPVRTGAHVRRATE